MTGNGGRREAAASMLKSAGYPGDVPKSGGRPVHNGPNAENASRRMEDISAGPGGKATIAEPDQEFADGGRARTTGATPESPLSNGSGGKSSMARGGRAKSRHRHARIVPPPPPPADPAMADAGAPPPTPPPGGAGATPDMMSAPAPGQQPFKSGGRAQPGVGSTNKGNPGMGAGGGLGRLRKAGLR